MATHASVGAITQELAYLLRETPHLAQFANEVGAAFEQGIETAAPLYRSFQMWGGPGSFADSAGVNLPSSTRRRVYELIVELFDEFERAGVRYERAAFWSSAFRSWLRDGLV